MRGLEEGKTNAGHSISIEKFDDVAFDDGGKPRIDPNETSSNIWQHVGQERRCVEDIGELDRSRYRRNNPLRAPPRVGMIRKHRHGRPDGDRFRAPTPRPLPSAFVH